MLPTTSLEPMDQILRQGRGTWKMGDLSGERALGLGVNEKCIMSENKMIGRYPYE
jgi:hypothetical protein